MEAKNKLTVYIVFELGHSSLFNFIYFNIHCISVLRGLFPVTKAVDISREYLLQHLQCSQVVDKLNRNESAVAV